MYLIQNLATGAYARRIGSRWGWTFEVTAATRIRGMKEAVVVAHVHYPNDDTEYLAVPEESSAPRKS